ncbi:acyl-CoA carboxylase subunit epsilon [Streptomyces sp. I05A-00742]|uniref:acyl-CoA carboxylase subunit epsilon n=1 Tax=Streptomyces sp. I05A-00742 TaxID=2732853 RepID=UPI001489EFDF|nr:acyl-CoA carboxylase subunit epsilon [Streptomyces sp. I05A-00742]
MTDMFVRVEKGVAGEEELAAVTTVLLACAATGCDAGPGPEVSEYGLSCTPARWRPTGFRAPTSWQG